MRVAWARCVTLPEHDMDEAPGLAAFRDAGHSIELVSWDEPAELDLSTFEAVLIRATWNYVDDPVAFAAWLEKVSRVTRVLNPVGMIRWNMHKSYLLEMEAKGLPIVPTVHVRRGEVKALDGLEWDDLVIKPAIGAGSFLTKRFCADGPEASTFLTLHTAERDMLIQPYMAEVAEGGERSLVWIDGTLSHVVEKSPRFDDDEESVRSGGEPSDVEVAFADRAIELAASIVGDRPLYARVDVIRRDDGSVVLSELELIEPSLFFDLGPGSAAAFVKAVERAVKG